MFVDIFYRYCDAFKVFGGASEGTNAAKSQLRPQKSHTIVMNNNSASNKNILNIDMYTNSTFDAKIARQWCRTFANFTQADRSGQNFVLAMANGKHIPINSSGTEEELVSGVSAICRLAPFILRDDFEDHSTCNTFASMFPHDLVVDSRADMLQSCIAVINSRKSFCAELANDVKPLESLVAEVQESIHAASPKLLLKETVDALDSAMECRDNYRACQFFDAFVKSLGFLHYHDIYKRCGVYDAFCEKFCGAHAPLTKLNLHACPRASDFVVATSQELISAVRQINDGDRAEGIKIHVQQGTYVLEEPLIFEKPIQVLGDVSTKHGGIQSKSKTGNGEVVLRPRIEFQKCVCGILITDTASHGSVVENIDVVWAKAVLHDNYLRSPRHILHENIVQDDDGLRDQNLASAALVIQNDRSPDNDSDRDDPRISNCSFMMSGGDSSTNIAKIMGSCRISQVVFVSKCNVRCVHAGVSFSTGGSSATHGARNCIMRSCKVMGEFRKGCAIELLSDVENVRIEFCRVADLFCTHAAIWLHAGSKNTSLYKNTIARNQGTGIFLDGDCDASLNGNAVSS